MAIPVSVLSVVNSVMNELGRLAVTADTDDDWAFLIAQTLPDNTTYLLQQAQWNFATKYYYSNSPNPTSITPQWLYAFSLPPDFLNFYMQYSSTQYEVIANLMYTNQNFVQYYYIANITDYTVMPQWFIQLLVYYTAWKVAKPLTQNTDVALEERSNFIREMTIAKYSNICINPVLELPYNPYNHGGSAAAAGGIVQ